MRILFFLIVALSLAACSSDKTENQFKTVDFSTEQKSENPNISFEFEGSIQLPDNFSEESKDLLRDNIISVTLGSGYVDFADNKVLKRYAGESFSEYTEMFGDYTTDEGDTTTLEVINCVTKLKGSVCYMNDKLISYERELYIYSGGAHGMTTRTNYIFDVASGDLVSEEQIFKPEYHRMVHNLLVRGAMMLRNDSILPAEEDAFFNNSLIQPNGNVSVNDSALVYTFNPYEIAPYCFGSVDIIIPKDEFLVVADTASVVYDHLFNTKK